MDFLNVSVCICTRRRQDGLKRLLESFEQMQIPPNVTVRIVVVENDTENFSENVVREISAQSKYEINYFLETRQGVVNARNRTILESGNCDFCCFTDDDQVVSQDWLINLLKCQREYDCDGVAGPTNPIFEKKVPACIKKFHSPVLHNYGTKVNHAYTGCLLLRKKYLNMLKGPFSEQFNFTGGEDTFLTSQITNLGGIIRYNPYAIAYEIVPDTRTTLKYVIKRKYMISNTAFLITSITDKKFSWFKTFSRLVLRFFIGLLTLIPFLIFGKEDRLKGLLKMVNAFGGFAFILGRKHQFYK